MVCIIVLCMVVLSIENNVDLRKNSCCYEKANGDLTEQTNKQTHTHTQMYIQVTKSQQ